MILMSDELKDRLGIADDQKYDAEEVLIKTSMTEYRGHLKTVHRDEAGNIIRLSIRMSDSDMVLMMLSGSIVEVSSLSMKEKILLRRRDNYLTTLKFDEGVCIIDV